MRLISFSNLLLFDNLAYTKYMLPERSSDEEQIKHNKSALSAWCSLFGIKIKNKQTCIVFSNGAFHTYGRGSFKNYKCGIKIKMEGRVSHFFPIFYTFQNLKPFLSKLH